MGALPGAAMANAGQVGAAAVPGDVPGQPRVRRYSGEAHTLLPARGVAGPPGPCPAAASGPQPAAAAAGAAVPPAQHVQKQPPLIRVAAQDVAAPLAAQLPASALQPHDHQVVASAAPGQLLAAPIGAAAPPPLVPQHAAHLVPVLSGEEPPSAPTAGHEVDPMRAPTVARDAAVVAAEVEDLTFRLRSSEEALAEERFRSRWLAAELEDVRAELEETRRYAAELEPLRGLASSGAMGGLGLGGTPGAPEEGHRRQFSEAATVEPWAADRPVRPPQMEADGLPAEMRGVMTNGVCPDDGSCDSEVRALRAELAERDRELLAAADARRKAAGQSEKVAAALRAKLTELEAVVAATPSASSRASSPHRSDCDFGSPSVEVGAALDEGVHTEMESSAA